MREKKSRICGRPIKKGVYQTIEILSNVASFLCRQKEWKQVDSDRLLQLKWPDGEKQLPTTLNYRVNRQHGQQKDIY